MTRRPYVPALGFALGALAAWYWGLSPAVTGFCAVAAVGWLLVPGEARE